SCPGWNPNAASPTPVILPQSRMYRRRVLGASVFFCCAPEMVSAAMNINNALSKSKRGIFLFMGARISRRTLIAPVGGFACRLLDRPQTGCILIYRDVWTVNTRWAFVLVLPGSCIRRLRHRRPPPDLGPVEARDEKFRR